MLREMWHHTEGRYGAEACRVFCWDAEDERICELCYEIKTKSSLRQHGNERDGITDSGRTPYSTTCCILIGLQLLHANFREAGICMNFFHWIWTFWLCFPLSLESSETHVKWIMQPEILSRMVLHNTARNKDWRDIYRPWI